MIRRAETPVDSQGGDVMGIGAGIFLIAIGAIFAFAVDANLGWLNLNVVGWVLMLTRVAGLSPTGSPARSSGARPGGPVRPPGASPPAGAPTGQAKSAK
jgi:hypothetical protein